MIKKNRRCAMRRKGSQKYCSEHIIYNESSSIVNTDTKLSEDERVPCPLDGKHTVWKKNLAVHLKKCNAKPVERTEEWFSKDINVKLKNSLGETEDITRSEDKTLDEKDLYSKYIPIIEGINFEPLQYRISEHSGLQQRLNEVLIQKHALQQSSLIGNIKDAKLLSPNNTFVEFGCGKAELSRFVNLCLLDDLKQKVNNEVTLENYGYGFIDRGVNRMKMDKKILKDCLDSPIEITPRIQRTRIDIKDLDLDKFINKLQPSKIVAISKHLCGAATDLTLKSLLNSSLLSDNRDKFGGLLIAMCCRHVCSYDQLLPKSREYLAEKGFKTPDSFRILKKMVSWAVCSKKEHAKNVERLEAEHISQLDYSSRERLGFVARRLIDESRVYALKSMLSGFEVKMFWYVEKDVTLENVCLYVGQEPM
ncbi:predicted protein [Scheffersomyces stipitis CBS 6054]|uniref:tRNA:m(4)X modification enzyme TRM13 n=1 Tax=Scheffersomyces stipitis (strain ATCC 58785 / CBS 6054 / NBRC 10063 / NRRL Y-11545) TaxID=322104 RepID=TRM13_PICST|nr:predicted protein [Scheffersomyces stipitis CBS 6054]A3LXS6.2 RecName: Full=tRNA:m(4)X modification enzyme TRM13; AltName: Full=tRNA methylase 13 [Scheffersomyces stipitis CBS 6054]ABN67518.2 predicted protein [Scheffersomyces stipitis CBS 6054]